MTTKKTKPGELPSTAPSTTGRTTHPANRFPSVPAGDAFFKNGYMIGINRYNPSPSMPATEEPSEPAKPAANLPPPDER